LAYEEEMRCPKCCEMVPWHEVAGVNDECHRCSSERESDAN
jgi:hypothetical protein